MVEAEGPGVETADQDDLDRLLLEAKVSVPPLRDGLVSRSHLVERARESTGTVIGVTAPAGYGKSALLAEWAHGEDRPVAWVSLDRFDDDPSVLLMLLASAYGKAFPDRDDLAAKVGGGLSPLARAAPLLATAFRSSTSPFVLIVDDFHELRRPDCHDVMSIAIAGLSAGSQLVTASRSEQPHLGRLRASGKAFEFGPRDLALDADGARAIFSHATVTLTQDEAAQVVDRTEGWPVGLYLAALIAKAGGDGLGVSGEHQFVADYLYQEAHARLSVRDQEFLRRTSLLEQVSGPLCEALLDAPDARQRLWDLAASNVFLVPLDRRREWFRYHGLFREFLDGELRRREPDLVTKLDLRAADWYEGNGLPGMALEHLLNTDEHDRCIRLLTTLVLPTYQAGNIATVQRWLTTVSDDSVRSYPPLAVLVGWVAAMVGDVAATKRWTGFVEGVSFSSAPADGSASFDSARAMLLAAVCNDGVEQMLADATLAVDLEPRWSPWRDTSLCLLGQATLLSGDVDRASRLFVEAAAIGIETGNADNVVLCEADLATLAMDAGRWKDAAVHVRAALDTIEECHMQDYSISLTAFAAAARLEWRRGVRDTTERHLTRAMRIRSQCTTTFPWLAVRGRLQLAKVHWALGETKTARQLLAEIDEIMEECPGLGRVADEVDEFRSAFTPSAGTDGGWPLSPAELRLLPYLQTHLTVPEISERLFISRNTVKSEVSAIYRKFGVSSRSEAVRHATALGLLGG